MLAAALGRWIVFFFVLIAATGDFISELTPRLRLLSPFLIPEHVELAFTTPRILYQGKT